MKLKTLSKINRATTFLLGCVMLPFAVVHLVFHYLGRPFEWVFANLLATLRQRIGNRLLLMSDEVRDGRIRNRHYLSLGTAVWVYRQWRDHHKFNDIPE